MPNYNELDENVNKEAFKDVKEEPESIDYVAV
jgi:hypothetical protein